MDAVSQIVSARARESDGLLNTAAASIAAHAVLVALVALGPALFGPATRKEEPPAMMISLGGAPGPNTGGMTQLGSRPVQQQLTEARKSVEPVRAPAARAPEMIEPKKAAPKKSETKAAEAKDPRSKTPTKGEEVRPGEAVAETKNRGQGFGLSSSGTDSSGGYLDVANFCCPEYLTTMRSMINQRWDGQQQAAAETTMKFVIQRDGRLTNIAIEKSSGYAALDLLAQRALVLTKQLPPLPAQFDQPSLTVYFIFRYQR